MQRSSGTIPRARERALILLAAIALAVFMTWPLAARLGSAGRTTSADWQYAFWDVGWVARTIVADPLHLYDANIYYPHRTTLAYSEANLLEGALALPVYWLTRNPYAAFNFVVLFSFASSWICAYLLARELTGHRAAAAIAAIFYAYCPYVFAHTSHIQLMMTAGLPLSMLMFHRLVDRPSAGRGVRLGLALAAQAQACAYYGIFAGLMIGFATIFTAAGRRLWRSREYWTAIAIAAAVSIACVLPFFRPYLAVQAESGFLRTLDDAARWSANPWNYLASSAHAHRWWLPWLAGRPYRTEILFPGFLLLAFGAAGLIVALRARRAVDRQSNREAAVFYMTLGALAFWASFGPAAGLYRVLYEIPTFSFLRAPSRLGIVLVLALSMLASFGVAALLCVTPSRWRTLAASAIAVLALGELNLVPFPWERAPTLPAAYAVLARLPRAPIAEFPFYGQRIAFHLHAQYMMFSTYHWMPMVNGYSDVIPRDFRDAAPVLDSFPSNDAFGVLARHRVRYITIHWDMFGPRQDEVRARLQPFTKHLRILASDSLMTLYEVVSFP
jgi:hypothetical protein